MYPTLDDINASEQFVKIVVIIFLLIFLSPKKTNSSNGDCRKPLDLDDTVLLLLILYSNS